MARYQPPFRLTPHMIGQIEAFGEAMGRWSAGTPVTSSPQLRRQQRLKSIQASLEIENNSLTLEQVTAVVAGRRVLGPPAEIQEVRNAFAAYEQMDSWQPENADDLLAAHACLMAGLIDDAGHWRRGGVGIYQGKQLIHMAPPADQVAGLMGDLLSWVATGEQHPLIASCVFHYEFEFIHPFADGNGRMGRLWQTLMLSQWKPILAWLPVETVIRDCQQQYYNVLGVRDRAGDSTAFIEFMLGALCQALAEAEEPAVDLASDQVNDQVGGYVVTPAEAASESVMRLLRAASHQPGPASAASLMRVLKLSHRPTFRNNYLKPALAAGWLEMTDPGSPRSPKQRYRLTTAGRALT